MWLTELTGFLSNVYGVLAGALRTCFAFLVNHIYLLFLPAIAGLKLIYDFFCAVWGLVLDKLLSVPAFDSGTVTFPSVLGLINSVYPIDETLAALAALFAFFVICHVIATLRGVKQTILF